jgi:predicted enzyme related to lactoylglutathione lyase
MSAMTTHVHGTFCWPELCSADVAASKKFYGSLLGWRSSDIHIPFGDYTIFKVGGQRVGAMYQMTEDSPSTSEGGLAISNGPMSKRSRLARLSELMRAPIGSISSGHNHPGSLA